MTDTSRDLGDYQTAVDAYVAAGYSKEGAEAVLNQHCAIVASHKPPAPAAAAPEPQPEPKEEAELEQESEQEQDDTADLTEVKEEALT